MGNDNFLHNIQGRIRNLGFAPSPMNSLFPLFEAVANAFHAIEERFGREASKLGHVTVETVRSDSEDENPPILGFKIADNGIGLDDDHWLAFRTADTPLKLSRGGKGVGRLAWLKVFADVTVLSIFKNAEKPVRRSFHFNLVGEGENPIKDHEQGVAGDAAKLGTLITLQPFFAEYAAHCPRKIETIASHPSGALPQVFRIL